MRTSVPAVLTVAIACFVSGCGEDFSDEAFGVLDLAPIYGDAASRVDPTEGVPQEILVSGGFLNGDSAEYYDFGMVAFKSDANGTPLAASVRPMYFFFGSDDAPLFSPPVREARDVGDVMRGGRQVLNPNPRDFCADVPLAERAQNPCTERNRLEKLKPYPTRLRDLLIDPVRGSADYQRPIVDVTPADLRPGASQYTGFWEIVEITAPRGYQPDSIKHADTLRRAIADGKFKQRRTGKVIDCPMLDERTYVVTGVTDRPIPRPRIELWYRRKLASCYLMHGWETLGNDQRQLFFANSDNDRVDTFDVDRLSVGEGTRAASELQVPLSRAYVPTIYTYDGIGNPPDLTYVADNLLTDAKPRHFRSDPPGYSPIRWMFNLPSPPDYEGPYEYQSKALKSVSQVDQTIVLPQRSRGASGGLVVKNLGLRGTFAKCGYPELTDRLNEYTGEHPCGRLLPNPDNPAQQIVDSKGDPKCNALGLECNKFSCNCDLPFVGYGQVCGPASAQCGFEKDPLSDQGFFCFPPWGGFCHLRCDARADKNLYVDENMGKKPTEFIDSRCKELPGYQCLALGSRLGICLKFCDQNIDDLNQCSAVTPVDSKPTDIGVGQTCQDWGVQVCTWPENYNQ
jgi:hypothetical protein